MAIAMPPPSLLSQPAALVISSLFVLLHSIIIASTHAAAPGLHFQSLSFANADDFMLQQNATLSTECSSIWLTPDTRGVNADHLRNLIGRVVYKEPLLVGEHGWSGKAATFRTQFTFQLLTQHASFAAAADGLAFFIAATSAVPASSEGEFLGIDDRYLSSSNERFFAVEFDTFRNSYDPSASHVGINVNTVASIATVDTSDPESPYNLYGGYTFRAWIEYDAWNDHEIRVWLDNCSQSKRACSQSPTSGPPLLVSNYDLSSIFCDGQPIYVGISASTGALVEGAVIYSWAFDAHP